MGKVRILRNPVTYEKWVYCICGEHERLFSDSFKKYLARIRKKQEKKTV